MINTTDLLKNPHFSTFNVNECATKHFLTWEAWTLADADPSKPGPINGSQPAI